MGRDNRIYGMDDTSMAESIASDALSSEVGDADYWGSIQDSRGIAKANVGAESTGPDDPDTPVLDGRQGALAGGGDSEPLLSPYPQILKDNRHAPGPKTATDEGGGVKTPPPRNQTGRPGAQSGPVYNKKKS